MALSTIKQTNKCNICVTNDHRYVPFFVIIIPSILFSWLATCCFTRATRRVSLVEQKVRILSEHPSSPPVLCVVRVAQFLVCFVAFCTSLFVLFFVFWPLYCLFFLFRFTSLVFSIFPTQSYKQKAQYGNVHQRLTKYWLNVKSSSEFLNLLKKTHISLKTTTNRISCKQKHSTERGDLGP